MYRLDILSFNRENGLTKWISGVQFSMSAVSMTTSLVLLLSFTLIGPSSGLLAASQTRSASTENKASVGKDDDFLKTVEASLLNIFGLKNRPKPQRRADIPEYMLELYDHLISRPGSSSPFPKAKGRGLTTANTVRSFFHKDDHIANDDCDGQTCVRIWFNVTNIPEAEVLAAAELRIFKDIHQLMEANRLYSADKNAKTPTRHRLEVHEIMQPRGEGSECISRLIDTKVVDLKNSEWESFDVHSAVLKWKKRPRLNHGLEIRLVTNNPSVTTDLHVRLRRSASISDNHWQIQRPLLVAYTDDGRGPKPRTRRSSGRARRRKNRKNRKRRRRKHKNQCRRHALYVDFIDVGWNDWIVAPSGYNAFYCHGDCPFPLAHNLNSTNHAIVQTLVNSVNPSAVPKACCVPTELTAISMLYLDEWDKVVLKNYQDMVVEACGCR